MRGGVRTIKCKLYNEPDDNLTALQQILYNRGIPLEDQQEWLDAGYDDLISWKMLGEEKIKTACNCLFENIVNNNDIFLPIDCDQDGYGAGALLINTEKHVKWAHHEGKIHGLTDMMNKIPEETKLVIITDAGSNDIGQHKELQSLGIDCICLDHHPVSINLKDSPAIIINVQSCDYPNKNLTGGGVVYKFCEAFNDIYCDGLFSVDYFFDLCAVSNIGDMADYRNKEIRAISLIGLLS